LLKKAAEDLGGGVTDFVKDPVNLITGGKQGVAGDALIDKASGLSEEEILAMLSGGLIGGQFIDVEGLKNAFADISGKTGEEAAREAAKLQSEAIDRAIEQQRGALGESTALFGKTEAGFNPFIKTGGQAFQSQAALSGALGQRAEQEAFARFQESPAQQFRTQQAEKSLLRNQALTGNLGGARTLQALQEQAIGFAGQDIGQRFNQLGQVSSTGLGFAQRLGELRTGLGGQQLSASGDISRAIIEQGRVQGQGEREAAQAAAAGTGNLVDLGSQGIGALIGALSDVRLKDNIHKVGDINGINFYSWTWNDKAKDLGLEGSDFGVLAQEMEEIDAELVIDGEYKMIKIDKVCELLEAS